MNLFIVEDSLLIQNRLMRFIEELPEVCVVGFAEDVGDTYEKIIQSQTDAIILDIQLRDGNSLVLLKKIKLNNPQIRIVVLSNHSNEANRMQALRAGADIFLDKSTDFAQIPSLLRRWQSTHFIH